MTDDGEGTRVIEALPAAAVVRPVRTVSLEAEIAPDAAARLFRLPCLAGITAGRSVPERFLWLDGADGALAARGVVMERPPRGPGRVAALKPGWADGVPEPTEDVTAPLLPFAGWEGRRREGVLEGEGGAVTVTLRVGRVRAAAAEAGAARVAVQGPAPAVLRVLHGLAAEAGAVPPETSLAGAARALSRGEAAVVPAPSPAPGLIKDLDTMAAEALRNAAGALLHLAPLVGTEADAVRRMRVAVRRLRAVLKATQPRTACPEIEALDDAAGGFGRRLGAARDWDVFLGGAAARVAEALGEADPRLPDPRLAALVRRAEARRAEARAALREDVGGADFRQLVWSLLVASAARPWEDGFPPPATAPHAAGLLARRWSRLRKRGAVLEEGDAAALHALRLAGKRLRYAAAAFAPLWPGRESRRFLSRLEALQDALGRANDAAVARDLAAGLVGRDARRAWAAGLVEGWCLGEARRARKEAHRAWKRLRKAEPFWEAAAPGAPVG